MTKPIYHNYHQQKVNNAARHISFSLALSSKIYCWSGFSYYSSIIHYCTSFRFKLWCIYEYNKRIDFLLLVCVYAPVLHRHRVLPALWLVAQWRAANQSWQSTRAVTREVSPLLLYSSVLIVCLRESNRKIAQIARWLVYYVWLSRIIKHDSLSWLVFQRRKFLGDNW